MRNGLPIRSRARNRTSVPRELCGTGFTHSPKGLVQAKEVRKSARFDLLTYTLRQERDHGQGL